MLLSVSHAFKFLLAIVVVCVFGAGAYLASAQSMPTTRFYWGGDEQLFGSRQAAADHWFELHSNMGAPVSCTNYHGYDGTPIVTAKFEDGAWVYGCVDDWGNFPATDEPIVGHTDLTAGENGEFPVPVPLDPGQELGGKPCPGGPSCGNPINPATGNKYLVETDIEVPASPLLTFTRTYNSSGLSAAATSLGTRWRHSFEYGIRKTYDGKVVMLRPDGRRVVFSAGLGAPEGERGVLDYVLDSAGNEAGWTYTSLEGVVERYGKSGRIESLLMPEGGTLTWVYDSPSASQASAVTDNFGRSLAFGYSGRFLQTVTAPDGATYRYYRNGQDQLYLINMAGSGIREYLYDETGLATANFASQLTGIIDERGRRFATYKYDAAGRAYHTSHAGAQSFDIAYPAVSQTGTSAVITTPLGATQSMTFVKVLGQSRVATDTVSCGDGSCATATRQFTYDVAGNQSSEINAAGVKTCRGYESARPLLVRSVAGLTVNADCSSALNSPPAGARVATFTWHPNFPKLAAIAVPLKVTAFTYDAAQRLILASEAATADTSGAQGFAASTVANRSTSYAYNSAGQLTGVSGPRAGQVTSIAYDNSGLRTSVTNPLGKVTSYSNFDGAGRPRAILLPSGANASLTYSGRGWLEAFTVEGEETVLTYNGAGMLEQARTPDGEVLSFTYNDAGHRTAVSDGRGNRVDITVDALGNPLTQQVRGSDNSLAASAGRVFDMMGRVRQVSGAQYLH